MLVQLICSVSLLTKFLSRLHRLRLSQTGSFNLSREASEANEAADGESGTPFGGFVLVHVLNSVGQCLQNVLKNRREDFTQKAGGNGQKNV